MNTQTSAFWRGARESIGAPIAVIAANYLGLGAFASATAVSVWAIVVSTFTIWALPGQLVMVDMWMVGAPWVAVLLAVMLTNVRFLPMSITIMPLMRDPAHPTWRYYFTAHFIAMTSWVVCMPRLQQMPAVERISYFIGFSLNCIIVGSVHTPMVAHMGAEARERRRKMVPMQTEGTAWDIAHGAVYLASDESRWVTGILLPIDGGLVALRAWPR